MTIRPARFSAGDLDRMYAAAFVENALRALRQGNRAHALGLFEIWLDYPWDFHGASGARTVRALEDFHVAVEYGAPLDEIERLGRTFLEEWTALLEDFVLFLMEADLKVDGPDRAERLFNLEQTYAGAGFAALERKAIEALLSEHPDPADYLEARRRLLALK